MLFNAKWFPVFVRTLFARATLFDARARFYTYICIECTGWSSLILCPLTTRISGVDLIEWLFLLLLLLRFYSIFLCDSAKSSVEKCGWKQQWVALRKNINRDTQARACSQLLWSWFFLLDFQLIPHFFVLIKLNEWNCCRCLAADGITLQHYLFRIPLALFRRCVAYIYVVAIIEQMAQMNISVWTKKKYTKNSTPDSLNFVFGCAAKQMHSAVCQRDDVGIGEELLCSL